MPLFKVEEGQDLRHVPAVAMIDVSTVATTFQKDVGELYQLCATQIGEELFASTKPEYAAWLLMSTGWMQPTRITAYKKLWKQLALWSIDRFTAGEEVMFESSAGVRYAGLLQVEPNKFVQAVSMVGLDNALIVSSRDVNSQEEIAWIYAAAYPPKNEVAVTKIDWAHLVASLCPLGDIIVRAGIEYNDTVYVQCFLSTEKLSVFGII